MKPLLLTLLLSTLYSTNQDTNINIYTYWTAGDTQTLRIQEGYIKYEDDKVVEKDISSITAEITVLAETDTTYTMQWVYKDNVVDRINIEEDEEDVYIDKRLEEMFSEVTLEYEINEFGELKRMLNLDKVMEAMSDSLRLLIQQEMDMDNDDSGLFLEILNEMFNSESMADEMTRDIYNYHYYHGNSFPPDTTIHYLDTIPNKLEGPSIPLTGVVTVKANSTRENIEINDLKQSDTGFVKSMTETIDALETPQSDKIKEEMENTQLSIMDIENYTYDYNLGWLRHYERRRIRVFGNTKKEQIILMSEIK
jgi:hypothetical protein